MQPNTAGLSLHQAPPLRIPARFFLTAPWWGVLAGLILALAEPASLANRWSPTLLLLTHLLTLGVFATVMLGAMFQMIPVVVGVVVPAANRWGPLIHGALSLGVVGLVLGWGLELAWGLHLALLGLTLALGGFVLLAGYCLWRAPQRHATLWGMALALLGLALTLGLGATLLAGHAWPAIPLWRGVVTDLHWLWGLLGWVLGLIIGVSYQVVPMFQMTPEYPRPMRRFLTPLWLLLLVIASATLLAGVGQPLGQGGLALGLALYGGVSGWLLQHRLRRVSDPTLWFWRLAMLALGAALICWWGAEPLPRMALYLFVVGFALSVINAMLYKILPFLVWFHLQGKVFLAPKPDFSLVPNMHEIIPRSAMRWQFLLHLLGLLTLLGAPLWPLLYRPAGMLLALSFALLGGTLWRAYRTYLARIEALDAQPAQ